MAAVGDQQERKRGALDQSQGAFLRFGSAVRGSGVTVMAANLGLAAVYLVCGKLGLSLAVVHANATPVWPPTGVALAALLIWGYRLWPGIFLGAFLVNLSTSGTLATSLGIAAGNTCEGLLGAWLVCRFAGGLKAFERTAAFLRFALLAGVASTTVSPTAGVTSLCLGGFANWSQYHSIWLTWWLGDMVSNFIVAPMLLIWFVQGFPRLKPASLLKAAWLLLVVTVAGLAVFLARSSSGVGRYPLTYLALLPLLWAAFQLGERGAVTAALVMDSIAVWGTFIGLGPFANHDPNKSLLALQIFVGTAALAAVVLALAVSEHKATEERLGLVIQGSSDGIWDWDLLASEVYYSSRWKSMLGYTDCEIQPSFSAWEQLLHPEDRARALTCVRDYLAGRTTAFELEHRLRHKDGSYRWILSRGVALRDEAGRPVRMAGSHVDLTARKETEDRLRRAYGELSESEASLKTALQELKTANESLQTTQLQLIQAAKLESVGTLAAGVAHEVKNPLQTILLGLDYLTRNFANGESQTVSVLHDIRDAVTRADTIVRELLQLSAARDFELIETDLNSVIDRSLWLLNNELIASQIDVVRNCSPDLPRVRLDRGKMEQVFINLFLNAIQAMSQNGVLTVSTRQQAFGEDPGLTGPAFAQFRPGDPVVIAEVLDTGKGIAAAHLPKIFDPFFTTKPAGQGTGLGLSVVKKIMDLQHAGIQFRNRPPGGVLVTLIFKPGDN